MSSTVASSALVADCRGEVHLWSLAGAKDLSAVDAYTI